MPLSQLRNRDDEIGPPMTEFVTLRASQILDQGELILFLKRQFGDSLRVVGKSLPGLETFEVRIKVPSQEFDSISEFIRSRRFDGAEEFVKYALGRVNRRYTKHDLVSAELLWATIVPHFEPCGEECGTAYETLCTHCNLGRQVSDLLLDLRRAPQHKDVCETISWTEWIVTSQFKQAVEENRLSGVQFRPVFDLRSPLASSRTWNQIQVTGRAGRLAPTTVLGGDPFDRGQVSWRCPSGHSTVTQFLTEIRICESDWDGSDISVTSDLFGQGRNLLRPTPLLLISQRAYRSFERAGIRGLSYEVAHIEKS
jgi:hypothetical protein